MRKLGSAADAEKKRKRNMTIVSILLLVILTLSTVGYSWVNSTRNTEEKTNVPQEDLNQGVLSLGGNRVQLRNGLDSVKEIPVESDVGPAFYSSSTTYIASDNAAVSQELASVLRFYAPRLQEACYGQCEKNLPERNCTDNLIVWKDATENRVYQQDRCVFIEGDMRAVDAFIYKFLGYS